MVRLGDIPVQVETPELVMARIEAAVRVLTVGLVEGPADDKELVGAARNFLIRQFNADVPAAALVTVTGNVAGAVTGGNFTTLRKDEWIGKWPEITTNWIGTAAQAVLTQARKEAAALRHEWVDTEHLLLALAAGGLLPLGQQELVECRGKVLNRVKPGIQGLDRPSPFTERTRRVIRAAQWHAGFNAGMPPGHREGPDGSLVQPHDLLFGLLTEPDGVAAEVLATFEVTATSPRHPDVLSRRDRPWRPEDFAGILDWADEEDAPTAVVGGKGEAAGN